MRGWVMATTPGGRSSYLRFVAYRASVQAAVLVGAAATTSSWANNGMEQHNAIKQRTTQIAVSFIPFLPSCLHELLSRPFRITMLRLKVILHSNLQLSLGCLNSSRMFEC